MAEEDQKDVLTGPLEKKVIFIGENGTEYHLIELYSRGSGNLVNIKGVKKKDGVEKEILSAAYVSHERKRELSALSRELKDPKNQNPKYTPQQIMGNARTTPYDGMGGRLLYILDCAEIIRGEEVESGEILTSCEITDVVQS
jgi:hypothetical protein